MYKDTTTRTNFSVLLQAAVALDVSLNTIDGFTFKFSKPFFRKLSGLSLEGLGIWARTLDTGFIILPNNYTQKVFL